MARCDLGSQHLLQPETPSNLEPFVFPQELTDFYHSHPIMMRFLHEAAGYDEYISHGLMTLEIAMSVAKSTMKLLPRALRDETMALQLAAQFSIQNHDSGKLAPRIRRYFYGPDVLPELIKRPLWMIAEQHLHSFFGAKINAWLIEQAGITDTSLISTSVLLPLIHHEEQGFRITADGRIAASYSRTNNGYSPQLDRRQKHLPIPIIIWSKFNKIGDLLASMGHPRPYRPYPLPKKRIVTALIDRISYLNLSSIPGIHQDDFKNSLFDNGLEALAICQDNHPPASCIFPGLVGYRIDGLTLKPKPNLDPTLINTAAAQIEAQFSETINGIFVSQKEAYRQYLQ